MGKRFIALFISFILGLISTPAILSNADGFTPSVVAFDDVKTEEITEKKSEARQVYAGGAAAKNSGSQVASSVPAAPNAAVAQPVMINYNVTQIVGSTSEFNSIAYSLSYSDIYRYNTLVYGHNSSNLLGNLGGLAIGEDFTITEGGVVTKYRVANKVIYELAENGQLNGDKNIMKGLIGGAMGHSVALMTCAGVSDGHGGASHRLVVFADAV